MNQNGVVLGIGAKPISIGEATNNDAILHFNLLYNKTSHTVFYHRYHVVWITKYLYKVLSGQLRLRVRQIISQAAEELGVRIVNGVLSFDHIHLMLEIPPHISVSNFVKIAKGRSSKNSPRLRNDIGVNVFGEGDFLALLVVMLLMKSSTIILTTTLMLMLQTILLISL